MLVTRSMRHIALAQTIVHNVCPVCAGDVRPIDPDCECSTCRNYSRAALHSALNLKLAASATLVSVHNVAYMQALTYGMRRAISEGRFVPFVQQFMLQQYPARKYPEWLRNAMEHAEIDLL